MTPVRHKDRVRSVHTRATHETVYKLCTKRGKVFYIGRTSKPLEIRLKEHIKTNTRELAIGRVKNPVLAEFVLKKGVTVHAVSPLLPCDQAKLIEDAIIASFKPVANLRGTGRKHKKNVLSEKERKEILARKNVPCEILSAEYGVAPCTISVIRKLGK